MLNELMNQVLINEDEENVPFSRLIKVVKSSTKETTRKEINRKNEDEENVPSSRLIKVVKSSTKETTRKEIKLKNDNNEDEYNVPLSRLIKVVKSSTKETSRKEIKRKNENTEEKSVKKKKELEWNPENWAQPIGKFINYSGEGGKKKCHYEKFEFDGKTYGLGDSVLFNPEVASEKPYVAIIKDIYIQGKEGNVKLEVQWFYRPEDVEKKYVGNWESKDARNLFYSFHRDEVFAESVKHSCLVYFVPENKQIPDRGEQPCFIVQNVYNTCKKKLWKFTHKGFNRQQKYEIGLLVAKTISQVGDLPDIEKEQKTLKSRRSEGLIMKVKRMNPESSDDNAPDYDSILENFDMSTGDLNGDTRLEDSAPDYKSILEKFDMSTGDLNRDTRLEELLEAVKHKCRLTEDKKANDNDYFWPNDAVPVVRALEQIFYDSMPNRAPKYNHKLEVLIDKLKNSRMLAERLLKGELKPEQIITMGCYELMSGHTFGEITDVIEEPTLEIDDSST